MSSLFTIVLIVMLVLAGSSILFLAIFGVRLINLKNSEQLEVLREKYKTILLTIGVILLLGSFSLIAFSGSRSGNAWSKEEKEEMTKKIMESSIFVHGIGADTARFVSECFIEKYTRIYTPAQMREQNKLSNEEISKLTSVLMLECLKKYGLPKIDSSTVAPTGGHSISR